MKISSPMWTSMSSPTFVTRLDKTNACSSLFCMIHTFFHSRRNFCRTLEMLWFVNGAQPQCGVLKSPDIPWFFCPLFLRHLRDNHVYMVLQSNLYLAAISCKKCAFFVQYNLCFSNILYIFELCILSFSTYTRICAKSVFPTYGRIRAIEIFLKSVLINGRIVQNHCFFQYRHA